MRQRMCVSYERKKGLSQISDIDGALATLTDLAASSPRSTL